MNNTTERISVEVARQLLAQQHHGKKRSKNSMRFSQEDFKALQARNGNESTYPVVPSVNNEPEKKRKNKYNNQKIDDFDSLLEKKFYDELLLLQTAKDDDIRVVRIQRQVKYELIPAQYDENGKLIEKSCSYIADFVVTRASGKVDVFDVKGVRTSTYILKRKLMLFLKGIQIIEITGKGS